MRTVLLQGLLIVVCFAVVGALLGVLWHQLWTPPVGVVAQHQWFTDEEGLRGAFSGTGLYVVIAAAGGFVLAASAAFLLDRSELGTLVAVLVGSLLAGWLMHRVGVALGPPDPAVLARTADDGVKLPGSLELSTWSPLLAFPGGALAALALVYLCVPKRRPGHRS